jgi:hypothetical protein
VLCLLRVASKEDATALEEKREARTLGRTTSASHREPGPSFSVRLSWERATLERKRERREVYGAAAPGERAAAVPTSLPYVVGCQ